MNFETLITENPSPSVQLVRLNRPDASNALNTRMAEELITLFENFQARNPNIRAVVVTGAGAKAFCAGADLKERREMADDAWFAQHKIFERAAEAMGSCPIPMIAAVNGAAIGGGCELALLCDLIFASATARFALPEARLGIMPGLGATQRLPRRIGFSRASEMLLTGEAIDAGQARDWGLANRVFPLDQLLPEALKIANRIASNGPVAVRQIKHAVGAGWSLPIHQAIAVEIEAYDKTVVTRDRHEGIRAFHEKRDPKFEGA